MTPRELQALKQEFRAEVEHLDDEFERLSQVLMPFYRERKKLRQELAMTYPHELSGEDEIDNESESNWMRMRVIVTGYSFPIGGERKELRAVLDRLSAEHRPIMNKRAEADRLRKAFRQRLKQLDKQKTEGTLL